MKIFEVASVKDCGDYYELDHILSNLNQDFENRSLTLGLNTYAATLIKKAIDNNVIVRINKDYLGPDVVAKDLIFVNSQTELELKKKALIQKVRQLVTHQQANVSGLMMYEYIAINNELCDKGFFIHDDNKEEVYLSILETGDEALIDKLERYLNARDIISRSSYLEQEYTKFYLNMNEADESEYEEVYNSFVKQYLSQVK